MYAIGIMSGTSLDGIDTVLVNIEGFNLSTSLKVIEYNEYPIPQSIKNKIIESCQENTSRIDHICSLNFEIGYLFKDAVEALLKKAQFDASQLDFIATHGQTIYHIPFSRDGLISSTLQIGEPAILAYRFNTTVISNFRVMDMAAGGQGAPLVPYSEYILYSKKGKNIALQNIGGIGNVTLLSESGDINDIYAFDTGPGNMMINAACMKLYHLPYDDQGHIASKGKVIQQMLDELMGHPYLKKLPPKSTGREEYGELLVDKILDRFHKYPKEDIITTLTLYTAKTIAFHYQRDIMSKCTLHEIIIGGGGSHNKTLLKFLKEELSPIPVLTQDELGYSSDAKEAIAFAILGNETLANHSSNVKSATGAQDNVVLGNITPKPR